MCQWVGCFRCLPWRRPDHPTGHDRFRQVFLDRWNRWRDLRLKGEVPPDQRAYVDEVNQRLLLVFRPFRSYAVLTLRQTTNFHHRRAYG
jgi:hypothetical protein